MESTVTSGLKKGISKLKALEHEVHVRTKQFQRKLAMLSVAILVAILGVGVWVVAAYQAFAEIMSPAMAGFVTGTILFAICGILIFLSQSPKALRNNLDKAKAES